MSNVCSVRLEKKEREYLRAEGKRRGNQYLSETIRELLGFPKSTPLTQPIPLLDQLELETPAIAAALHELITSIDEMRRLVTQVARKQGLTLAELKPIGQHMREIDDTTQLKRANAPKVEYPEGFVA